MIKEAFVSKTRTIREIHIQTELCIVGGGLAGVCAAIAAAREGIKVVLAQDRPVLGGNASSEVRLWTLGASSHLGNNNRWSREGGIIDEILVENLYRNKEGNPVILDSILIDKVLSEKNIFLLLNTQIFEITKDGNDKINSAKGFCSQNSTFYTISAPLFVDSSGDGIVAFLAGASFRMGAENKEEFDEGFAPDMNGYGELLGHTIYFYTKKLQHAVNYVAPDFALKDIAQIPRFQKFNSNDHGCSLWWVEYGGRLDTIHDTEKIKFELWKVVYGIWDYIKNSGKFPDAENLTLEWVGTIPGKRESRRFIGDYMLTQKDIIEQRQYDDAVAHGGWAIDLHPADGVFSKKSGCTQWHSKGVYQIPYRIYYSKDIQNLFLAGRIISASHVAFGSTRVMATSGAGGQVVGTAAALCLKMSIHPAGIYHKNHVQALQQKLLSKGHYIPGHSLKPENNLAHSAKIHASSSLSLSELPGNGTWLPLDIASAQMLPFQKGNIPIILFNIRANKATMLAVEFRISSKQSNYTPDCTLYQQQHELSKGEQELRIEVPVELKHDCFGFICFMSNPDVSVQLSDMRMTGVLSVFRKENPKVSNYGKQTPPTGIGVEEFEFWTPKRRPDGQNFAFILDRAISCFQVENLMNGIQRPFIQPNAWVADLQDEHPEITFHWDEKQEIHEITLFFDTDYDHPLESVQMGHPEQVIHFCIRSYELLDEDNSSIFSKTENHQAVNYITFASGIQTQKLTLKVKHPLKTIPAAVFGALIQ